MDIEEVTEILKRDPLIKGEGTKFESPTHYYKIFMCKSGASVDHVLVWRKLYRHRYLADIKNAIKIQGSQKLLSRVLNRNYSKEGVIKDDDK